nr:hypothetical protein [Desulfobacterales bacterium]
ESPESILEQQSGSSPESETIHADHKPRTAVKKESPLTYQKPPRKKWVIFGVGAAVLILFLSFGVWRMILEPENSGTENIVEDHHSQKMPQPPENVNGERLTLDMLRELLRKLDSNEEKLKIQEEKIARLEKQLALLEQNPALKPVRISWDPIDGAQGYQIYYGSASGVYEMIINVGDVLEYTFDNLEPGIYYYAVTAYNEYGESGFSQERALDLTQ